MEALLSLTLLIGYDFETCSCIIIDIEGNHLVLSAKHSLINSVQQLPLNLSQIHPSSVVHVSC
jgi:rRNA biogenesis protein RRP5